MSRKGRKKKQPATGAESLRERTEAEGNDGGRKGKGRAEVVICRGETAEGEKRLQMKLLTFSCVGQEGAKASLATARWVVDEK